MWFVTCMWFGFTIGFFYWMSVWARKRRKQMETNKCGRIHLGPVEIWQGTKMRCVACNTVLSATEVQTFNKIRNTALDTMAKALLKANSR